MTGGIKTYWPKNPNLPFHPAGRAGDYVYVSGQVGKDEKGTMVGGTMVYTRQGESA